MLKAPSMAANELLTRTAGGTTTQCRWEGGRHVLTEEDAFGDLTRTYIGRSAAHVDGTNPSTGTWRFYVHDHLGSTRGVYNSDKTQYAAFEHDPYGEVYASSGSVSDISRRYTGHDWDDAAELYYAPYRYYAAGLARWITRDPLGMVDGPNVYGYVQGNPVENRDLSGLCRLPEENFFECVGRKINECPTAAGMIAIGGFLAIVCGLACVGTMGLGCALCVSAALHLVGVPLIAISFDCARKCKGTFPTESERAGGNPLCDECEEGSS